MKQYLLIFQPIPTGNLKDKLGLFISVLQIAGFYLQKYF